MSVANTLYTLTLIFLISLSSYANTKPQLYTGNQRIIRFLLTPHEELKNPECLLQVFDYSGHNAFIAAGGHINSIEVKTDFDEKKQEAWFIKLIYDVGAYQQVICQLK